MRSGHIAALLLGWAAMSTAFGPSGVMRSASLHRAGQLRGVSNAVRACRRNLGRFGAEPGHGIQGRRTFALCMLAPERLHYEGISNRDKKGEGKKVLVAGGAGYIGSHVCADLLLNGYEVVVLDNFMNSSPAAIRRVEKLTGKSVTVYEADTRDYSALMRVFESEAVTDPIDTVVHLAGLKAVGESVEQPHLYYDNNVVGSINLARAMAEAGCKKLVFSSSATVYGDARSSPIKECHPLSATSPYGRSKLYIEEMLRDTVAADKDWSVAILRYFNPVGAHPSGMIGEDPKGVPNNLMPFITKVAQGKQAQLKVFGKDYPTKDGTGIRDYLHICDLEKLDEIKGSEVYNLGTGRGVSVLEMVGEFEKASKAEVPYEIVERRKGDVAICFADPSKAAEGLRWRAKLGLEDMCQDLWRWIQHNPEGYALDVIETLPGAHAAHVRVAHNSQVPTQHKIHRVPSQL